MFFVYFRSFETHILHKNVVYGRIITQIVGLEVEYADHHHGPIVFKCH